MKQEEMEMQLWEYIDGVCSDADRQRIALLISSDVIWQQMYAELSSLHEGISEGLEIQQPSMRFTKNVLDAVQAAHVAPPVKQYINRGIIRGIAALYIIAIVAALGYAMAVAKWDIGNDTVFSKLNLSGFFSGGFFTLVVCVNIVLGLMFVDLILRKNRLDQPN